MNKHVKNLIVAASSLPAFAQMATIVSAQKIVPGDVDLLGGTPLTPGTGYARNLGSVLSSVLNLIVVIAALLVLFYLILGGIEWITSGGDKGKTEGARNKITSAVIGIIVLAASYAIFRLIITFLGFTDVNDLVNVTPII